MVDGVGQDVILVEVSAIVSLGLVGWLCGDALGWLGFGLGLYFFYLVDLVDGPLELLDVVFVSFAIRDVACF